MADTSITTSKGKPLPWLKMNLNEFIGEHSRLTYEELGFLLHVAATLWATPGATLAASEMTQRLRIKEGSREADLLNDLIGYAIQRDRGAHLSIPWLTVALRQVTERQEVGRISAQKRWGKQAPTYPSSGTNTGDF